MIRALLVATVALAGCIDRAPDPDEDPLVSCEIQLAAAESAPVYPLDVVIAISDAPSMAPYAERLAPELRDLMTVLAILEGGLPDLRVAVVGDDSGQLWSPPGCLDAGARYLVDDALPWFTCDTAPCRERNYAGELRDAAACLGDVPPAGAPAPPLLARVVEALDSAAFVRPNAWLALILITAEDDASPQDPAVYLDALRTLHAAPHHLVVSVIAPSPAPRLEEILEALPNRASWVDLDADTWSDALLYSFSGGDQISAACLHEDLDEADCVVTSGVDGPRMPPCTMATPDRPAPDTPLPCWRLQANDEPGCEQRAIVERAAPGGPGAYVRCPCD